MSRDVPQKKPPSTEAGNW